MRVGLESGHAGRASLARAGASLAPARTSAGLAGAAAVALALALFAGAEARSADAPERTLVASPYDVLGSPHLRTPVLDPAPICLPRHAAPSLRALIELAQRGELDQARRLAGASAAGEAGETFPELDTLAAIAGARAARTRSDRREALGALRGTYRGSLSPDWLACASLELARLQLLLHRLPEAGAHLERAGRWLAQVPDSELQRESQAWYTAELLYQSGQSFEAHLALRPLARSDRPRIAAAARLRLADLSFDAGRSERVRVEYEALLPRAEAFGANPVHWAPRAAEVALDSGNLDAARAWLERYVEEIGDRDLRAVAQVRLADIDVLAGRTQAARERLQALSARRGVFAAFLSARGIDLGIEGGEAEQRVRTLYDAARFHDGRVRRYALGVLLRELVALRDWDGAAAVATRLAYEGQDTVLVPYYELELAALFEGATPVELSDAACLVWIRRLGGRYGILVRRAADFEPFVRLGECYEHVGMPDLAVPVYRATARAFGGAAATRLALPLARASLAIGEAAVARTAAEAQLRSSERERQRGAWTLLLAHVDWRDGRPAEAREGLREVLASENDVRLRLSAADLWTQILESPDGPPAEMGDRALLERELGTLADAFDASSERQRIGVAALRLAALRRAAGENSLPLYRLAASALDDGALRAESLYWQGRLQRGDARREAWSRAEAADTGAWSQLARAERQLMDLRARYAQEESS